MIKTMFDKYQGMWYEELGIKTKDATIYLIRGLILYSLVTAAIIYITISLIAKVTRKEIKKTKVKK